MYVFGILVYRDLSRQIQRQWPGYRHVIITLYYLCLFIFICRFSLSTICEKLGPVRYLYAIPSTPPLAILCSRYDRLIYAFFVIIIPKMYRPRPPTSRSFLHIQSHKKKCFNYPYFRKSGRIGLTEIAGLDNGGPGIDGRKPLPSKVKQ